MGIRAKVLSAFVGLSLVPLGIVALNDAREASRGLISTNEGHLRRELAASVGLLERYFAALDADARTLARLLERSRALSDGRIDPQERLRTEQLFSTFASVREDYYQVRFLDHRGHEQVRINRGDTRVHPVLVSELQDKSGRYYFRDAMKLDRDQTYVSRIDLNVEQGKIEDPQRLVFRVAHQVRDEGGSAAGLVLLNLAADTLLERIAVLRPGPQGAVLLVHPDGDYVIQSCDGDACANTLGAAADLRERLGRQTFDSLLAGETRVMADGGDALQSFAVVNVGDQRWHLVIAHPPELVLGAVTSMRRRTILVAVGVALVALMLGLIATRALVNPLGRILRFVEAVGRGKFGGTLTVSTNDEIEQLADAVTQTAGALEQAQEKLESWNEQLQAEVDRKVAEIDTLNRTQSALERRLQQADRLAALGMQSAVLAHEIGNPLAGIKSLVQLRLKDPGISEKMQRSLDLVLSETDRLAKTLSHSTGRVRSERSGPVKSTIREVHRRIELLMRAELDGQEVELTLDGDAIDQTLILPEHKLEQVLLNLVMNSMQAMEQAGRISVTANSAVDGVEIAVRDTGPGIPEGAHGQVFEPFFTTKVGGSGLGLPIVRDIVDEMGGVVRLEPSDGGACVIIVIPTARDHDEPEQSPRC